MTLMEQAAQTMRALALDEDLKDKVAADPVLRELAWRVAERYVGGRTLDEALTRAALLNAEGTPVSLDYMGESCRDAGLATAETEVFLDLSRQAAARRTNCSLSFDLSHLGSLVDRELGLANATRLAEATAAAGQEMMISMEGSDRTDLILWTHERLCERFGHVGVTVQARLHRTAEDLPRLLLRPGRIRLTKGSYLEPESVAHPRGSRELRAAYLACATLLLERGHLCSIATHDLDLLTELQPRMRPDSGAYEVEMLMGLGTDRLAAMRERGHPVREYIVFGTQWWLYVWNRIAEEPARLFQALTDAGRRA
ncbi:proline dehydrogenase family protein [Nonomuraea rhodomycinica]|uniref:Proline dehydrogenase family protein n=1 Tax=Nonomuraea rhodomycinica TaxID=1712872 RepID=A0A7Y6IPX4_9ACTN|nr:proline dehydrogenase family protein [Nonomuraea rhodomycinica]NUW41708.1 proline dehydrogenase family protein [Nonomuraea rhodomycinica]